MICALYKKELGNLGLGLVPRQSGASHRVDIKHDTSLGTVFISLETSKRIL